MRLLQVDWLEKHTHMPTFSEIVLNDGSAVRGILGVRLQEVAVARVGYDIRSQRIHLGTFNI